MSAIVVPQQNTGLGDLSTAISIVTGLKRAQLENQMLQQQLAQQQSMGPLNVQLAQANVQDAQAKAQAQQSENKLADTTFDERVRHFKLANDLSTSALAKENLWAKGAELDNEIKRQTLLQAPNNQKMVEETHVALMQKHKDEATQAGVDASVASQYADIKVRATQAQLAQASAATEQLTQQNTAYRNAMPAVESQNHERILLGDIQNWQQLTPLMNDNNRAILTSAFIKNAQSPEFKSLINSNGDVSTDALASPKSVQARVDAMQSWMIENGSPQAAAMVLAPLMQEYKDNPEKAYDTFGKNPQTGKDETVHHPSHETLMDSLTSLITTYRNNAAKNAQPQSNNVQTGPGQTGAVLLPPAPSTQPVGSTAQPYQQGATTRPSVDPYTSQSNQATGQTLGKRWLGVANKTKPAKPGDPNYIDPESMNVDSILQKERMGDSSQYAKVPDPVSYQTSITDKVQSVAQKYSVDASKPVSQLDSAQIDTLRKEAATGNGANSFLDKSQNGAPAADLIRSVAVKDPNATVAQETAYYHVLNEIYGATKPGSAKVSAKTFFDTFGANALTVAQTRSVVEAYSRREKINDQAAADWEKKKKQHTPGL